MTMEKAALHSWRIAFVIFASVALLFYLIAGREPSQQRAPLGAAADFSYPDVKGKMVSLSDYKSQIVLLDFWATWCDPCVQEVPDLKKLQTNYSARGFSLLGVSLDEETAEVGPFVKEYGINYPVLLSQGHPPKGYRLPGIPTAFLISRDGQITRRYFGPQTYETFARDVEALLAAEPPPMLK